MWTVFSFLDFCAITNAFVNVFVLCYFQDAYDTSVNEVVVIIFSN